MKTKYVVQLDDFKQKKIKEDLNIFYKDELNLNDEEMKVELKLAMSGRLVDLEDSIDISPYLE